MIDKAIDEMPPKIHKWITVMLLLLVTAFVSLFAMEYNPKTVILPVAENVRQIQTRIDTAELKLRAMDGRFNSTERFFCNTDRASAVLSGIDCRGLLNER